MLLDEPTRGLDPEQRSELIKTLRHFKKHRYLVIQSSDQDLINTLADLILNIGPNGAQTIDLLQVDYSVSSYQLIVEVEGGKPSEYLIRYLQKDTEELILEYTTETQHHYILPNLSKDLLLTKSNFMEVNKQLLGLIFFEFSTRPYFDSSHNAKTAAHLSITNVKENFEESIEMQDNSPIQPNVVVTDQNLLSDVFAPEKGSKMMSYDQGSLGSNQ